MGQEDGRPRHCADSGAQAPASTQDTVRLRKQCKQWPVRSRGASRCRGRKTWQRGTWSSTTHASETPAMESSTDRASAPQGDSDPVGFEEARVVGLQQDVHAHLAVGPVEVLQPGEPHGRQQGATDLHRKCGASRRSREKRHGRNETRGMAASGRRRTGKLERSGSVATVVSDYGITDGKGSGRRASCSDDATGSGRDDTATTNGSMLTSVSTSFGRGQQCAGSGHTKRTSTEGRIFENTMRGVRQDSSRQAACSRPRTTPVE
jgi:hypothetical protein